MFTDEPSTSTTPAAAVAATPATVKVEKTFSLPGMAFCVAEGADEEAASRLFAGLSDFAVYQFDPTAEKVEARAISESKHDSYVMGLVHSGSSLVSGSYDGSLIWWNPDTGEIIRRVEKAHDKWVRMLAVTPDGRRVVSVADDMRTRVWDAATGERIFDWGDYEQKTPQGYPSMLYAVAVSPDGKWLATGDRTGRVLVRDLQTGNIAATIETPVMYTWDPKARRHSIGGIRSVAFSGNSELLAVGGMGKVGNIDHLDAPSRIEIFHWQTQERRHEIEDSKFKGLVEAMQFGPGDSWLIAAGGDHNGFVSLFSMQDGKVAAQEKTGQHVHDFVMNAAGTSLTTVGHQQGTVVSLS
ncbi:MAG: PQQ-binding-like beta-propeller repeat protein [Planctomycetaceae bacterium]|nr:PQQ-binding-like beta-propeller repeat protein [Planctomycetaceae bacterium]